MPRKILTPEERAAKKRKYRLERKKRPEAKLIDAKQRKRRHKERMATDPVYRAKITAKVNQRYLRKCKDPEVLIAKRAERLRRESLTEEERIADDIARRKQWPSYQLRKQEAAARRAIRNDPAEIERRRKRKMRQQEQRRKIRMSEDPEYRAKINARRNRRSKERLKDPEYRAKIYARSNRRRKERLKDPVLRAVYHEQKNMRRVRAKSAKMAAEARMTNGWD